MNTENKTDTDSLVASYPEQGINALADQYARGFDSHDKPLTDPRTVTGELQYTPKEKRAAMIVDQLCPVIADETKVHISPTLFKRLTVRLAELL